MVIFIENIDKILSIQCSQLVYCNECIFTFHLLSFYIFAFRLFIFSPFHFLTFVLYFYFHAFSFFPFFSFLSPFRFFALLYFESLPFHSFVLGFLRFCPAGRQLSRVFASSSLRLSQINSNISPYAHWNKRQALRNTCWT